MTKQRFLFWLKLIVVWTCLEASLTVGMGYRRWAGLGLTAFIVIVAIVGWRVYLSDQR